MSNTYFYKEFIQKRVNLAEQNIAAKYSQEVEVIKTELLNNLNKNNEYRYLKLEFLNNIDLFDLVYNLNNSSDFQGFYFSIVTEDNYYTNTIKINWENLPIF